ncbi:hypothetical protein SD37_26930 [Amycolatopsis orientalis]|uniref:PAS fold-3 domain-containing protein n=2 Tax=Amycolatopsis orientalis TaxID=31958 RepID=A0A193C389_AMYOR|nr:hypothetical protein SD37_26930 [Amycolatopsis orientalis]
MGLGQRPRQAEPDPGTVQPTTKLLLSHKHPEDRDTVAGTLAAAVHDGTAFCGRHRIIDTAGIEHHVLVVGDRASRPPPRPTAADACGCPDVW